MSAKALPIEILLEIFLQSLPHRLDEEGRLAFQIIRSVCSMWRFTSFSSPVLWSSISVTRARSDSLSTGSLPALVDRWFSRAGPSAPLELDYDDTFGLPQDEALLPALIRRHQSRWRHLSLCIRAECFCDIILSPPSNNGITLQALTLWVGDLDGPDPTQISQRLDGLAKLASFRRLVLEDDRSHMHERPYGPITLSELHIIFDGVLSSDHIHLISAFHSLSTLSLVVERYFDVILSAQDHLTLPSLLNLSFTAYDLDLLQYFTTPALVKLEITLKLNGYDPDNSLFFSHSFTLPSLLNLSFTTYNLDVLEYFTTPALVKLEITLQSDIREPQNSSSFSQFITRCTSALQSIAVNSDFDASLITRIITSLSARPSLTDLTVDLWPLSLTFPKDAEKDWCPDLQHLTVSFGSGYDDEEERMEALAAFLQCREEWGCVPLERLTIRKRHKRFEFPYGLFENVTLGKLHVMVPL
ncbi:hypothetical protein BKA70DRAFT_72358 [Coprinopsis sp. MPI-PUGE-AT-0042]|nr:hypothetical protein BKA70DRAFT_72358 [Coprinopsis sp. MPI-PUGE-AT-0042]